ncbi:MAG: hypothetical protein MUP41_08120 [Desulfobacterales bacterium]|nr:hypothetical protein [Desulfobacterales bacterium]
MILLGTVRGLASDRRHREKGVEIIRKKEYSLSYRGYRGYAAFVPCETQSRCGTQKGKKSKEVFVK